MARYIPETFRKMAEESQDSSTTTAPLEEQSSVYIPDTFKKIAQQSQEENQPVPNEPPMSVNLLRKILPHVVPFFDKDIGGPMLSEGVSSLAGLPVDMIGMTGELEGPVGKVIKEYLGSEGIRKRVTEPIREMALGSPEDEYSTKTEMARRFGRLAGPGTLAGPLGVISAGMGAVGGQGAKELGFGPTGQTVSEALFSLAPGALKNAYKWFKSPAKTMPSGITELQGIGKEGGKGFLTTKRQEQTINKLNEEASLIAEKTFKKRMPILEEIERGVDFESEWKRDFGRVRQLAERANPDINIIPTINFMDKQLSPYKGVSKLSDESANIVKEIKSFSKKPPQDLSSLLNNYRENNKKMKAAYETAHITGKHKDYIDFLENYNNSIKDSIKTTLPEGSPWMKMFEKSNARYKSYLDTLKVQGILEPILGKNPSISQLTKIAIDPKLKKKLTLAVGKDTANQFSQIASDLKEAHEMVKSIPVKDLKFYDKIFPLHYVLPLPYVAKAGLLLPKVVRLGKFRYGKFLTSPKKAGEYQTLLEAFIKQDKSAYTLAAANLLKSLERTEEPEVTLDQEEITLD